MSDISSKVGGIAVTVVTSAIIGGFVWVQDVSTRLALVEDDLGETVDVISLLHPPSKTTELVADQEVFFTGDKGERRRSKLEQLKRQVAETPPKGDDDDSSVGDDDDSSAPPRRET